MPNITLQPGHAQEFDLLIINVGIGLPTINMAKCQININVITLTIRPMLAPF